MEVAFTESIYTTLLLNHVLQPEMLYLLLVPVRMMLEFMDFETVTMMVVFICSRGL